MFSRLRLLCVTAAVAALLTGCSGGPNDSAVPASGAATKPRPERAGPATTREEFMPALVRAQRGVSWPPAYTMTPEQLWQRMAPGAIDTAYTDRDATDIVTIWNACAWTLQLIDDKTAARPADRDVAGLNALDDQYGLRDLLARIVADSGRDDLGAARQFVTANDCAAGFN